MLFGPCEIFYDISCFSAVTRFPYEISCFWAAHNVSVRFSYGSSCFLPHDGGSIGSLVWWSDVCNLKNVCLLWAVTVFLIGFFHLLFMRVDM